MILSEARVNRRRLARLVTEVLAPAPVAAVVLALIAGRTAPTPVAAIVWGGIAILFAAILPLANVVRQLRAKEITDLHVRRREQRPRLLLFGVGSLLAAFVLLLLLGAPVALVAAVGAGVVGLVIALAITLFWKISLHVAAAAGAVVALAHLLGPGLFGLTPLVAAVAWSRVELGDHTPAQVVAGGLVGAVVAAVSIAGLVAIL